MKPPVLLKEISALGVCALLVSALGSAEAPVPPGRSMFPDFIPLDASQYEYPEGVAVDKVGNVFVSIGASTGPRGAILKFTPSGEKSVLVDFGTPGAVGLAVDADGDVYVARTIAPNNGALCPAAPPLCESMPTTCLKRPSWPIRGRRSSMCRLTCRSERARESARVSSFQTGASPKPSFPGCLGPAPAC